MKSYIYCFIREDISPEQKIVQIGHACYEAGRALPKEENHEIPNLILLSVQDEDDLKLAAAKMECAGIDFSIFYEPDCNRHTGDPMGYSAICSRPVISPRERTFFRDWPLYRHAY